MLVTTTRLVTLGLLLINVALVSSAQLLLKIGSGNVSQLLDKKHIITSVIRIALSPHIFFGITGYVVSLVLWIYILTRSQLSIAYPLMSLSYVVVMILSIMFLSESVNLPQWGGAILIVIGTSTIFLFK